MAESGITKELKQKLLESTVERLAYVSWFLSGALTIFGFSSFPLLQSYDQNLTLFANVWPRVLFNSLPLVVLALFMKKGKALSSAHKIVIWTVSVCLIFDAAAMVHVWPLALQGSGELLLHVHGTNVVFFAVILIGLAPSVSRAIASYLILGALAWTPLFTVAVLAGNPAVANTIIGDTLFLTLCASFFGVAVGKVHGRLASYEANKELQAKKFLGPLLSRAIYDNKSALFARVRRKGYIISIDIRDSTELQKELREDWLSFRQEYFSMVARVVAKHNGFIQKTVGDCHVINFGVMDESPDLSDIPGIATDEARAEERRLEAVGLAAFSCLEETFKSFQEIAREHFPDRAIRLGGGIDKGIVEKGIQGDENTLLELDVNGDPVNCSNRLQEYSKALQKTFYSDSSLLVISPFAADHLGSLAEFRRVETVSSPIRNYPLIRWVLVREFQSKNFVGSASEKVELLAA